MRKGGAPFIPKILPSYLTLKAKPLRDHILITLIQSHHNAYRLVSLWKKIKSLIQIFTNTAEALSLLTFISKAL